MRKFISILNVIAASGMAALSILALIPSLTLQTILLLVACLVWVFFAVWLLRARAVWPWLGSLIFVLALTLMFGAQVLHFLSLIWRAEYGDRSVHLDPSTVGIPLFGSGLFTVGALVLLVALLSMPAWPVKKGADA